MQLEKMQLEKMQLEKMQPGEGRVKMVGVMAMSEVDVTFPICVSGVASQSVARGDGMMHA